MKKQEIIDTSKRNQRQSHFDRPKRFVRKPGERSQRSSSRKSYDSSVKQSYIKSPSQMKRQKPESPDFFAALACSILQSQSKNNKKEQSAYRHKNWITERKQANFNDIFDGYEFRQRYDYEQTDSKYSAKIQALQAQIELKNHELDITTGQIKRLKYMIEVQRKKIQKMEIQKKQQYSELESKKKQCQDAQLDLHKYVKQKQHLLKQIQFLQRINYDEKTRSLQSYREKYLQEEVEKLRKQLHKSKGQREFQLENEIRMLKEEKFTIQSLYKAMKVANECLIKQISYTQENFHDIILNSEEYKRLREKYVRFLEEYKVLRNQYWSLKAEANIEGNKDSDSLFSLTDSQIQNDLSILKSQSTSHSPNSQLLPANLNQSAKTRTAKYEDYEPSYSTRGKFS